MVGLVSGESLPVTYLAKCTVEVFLWVISIGPWNSMDGLYVGHAFVLPQQLPDHLLPQNKTLPRGRWRETLPDTQPSHPSFPCLRPGSNPALLSQPASPRPVRALSFRLLTPRSALVPFMGQLQAFITPGSLTPASFVCQPEFKGRAWKRRQKAWNAFGRVTSPLRALSVL